MRRRRRRSEVFHYPVPIGGHPGHGYIDVDGREQWFHPADRDLRDLYLAAAQSTLLTFKELYNAMAQVVFGANDAHSNGLDRSAWKKLKRKIAAGYAEAKQDAALLKLPLPLEEAVAIWKRSCEALRLIAELTGDPAERQAILNDVAESERRMSERIELHRQRYEERRSA
jgi:hypothetical protein